LKILNKPTLMFLFVIFILFFVIFQFLQSPKVAELIADRITKNILIKEGFEVDFEKVDLRIFPPATYFKNFKVAKLEEGGLI